MAVLDDDPAYAPRPIVLITGSNGGVGYGIALRLLHQLSLPAQSDVPGALVAQGPRAPSRLQPQEARPAAAAGGCGVSPFATPNGVTLVMACRNAQKAVKARDDLRAQVAKWARAAPAAPPAQRGGGGGGGASPAAEKGSAPLWGEGRPLTPSAYRRLWCPRVEIDVVPLDLASFDAVYACADLIKARYPYLTHVLLNAGCGPFKGLDWVRATSSILTHFLDAVTYPTYILESPGRITADGLGWTFQCNLFSHYLLLHALLPLLWACPFPLLRAHPRIIWTSSLDGLPAYCDPKDWQGVNTSCTYQSTKYQMSLLGWGVNSVIRKREAESRKEALASGGGAAEGAPPPGEMGAEPVAYSFVCHPGVTAGDMFLVIIGRFMDLCMRIAFYLARLAGSVNHPISPVKAGVAWTYVCLAPLAVVLSTPTSNASANPGPGSDPDPDAARLGEEGGDRPLRFGARANRWGREYVGVEGFDPEAPDDDPTDPYGKRRWYHRARAEELLEYCEDLRVKVEKARGLLPQ